MIERDEPTDLEARAERIAARLRGMDRWVSLDLRVNADVAAELLGVEEKTLANWRAESTVRLRWTRPAGRCTYWLVDLLRFIDDATEKAA